MAINIKHVIIDHLLLDSLIVNDLLHLLRSTFQLAEEKVTSLCSYFKTHMYLELKSFLVIFLRNISSDANQ